MKYKAVLDNKTYSIKKNSTPRVNLNGIKLNSHKNITVEKRLINKRQTQRRPIEKNEYSQ